MKSFVEFTRLAFANLGFFLIAVSVSAAEKPNIVFVFSDDHATQAVSAYGGILKHVAPTPHLDKLADSGMLFARCLVTNSICGPSRATILTGKYSHLNGFVVNEGTEFDGTQQTFPKLLRKVGYQTAVIGKWHLGSEPTGFDHWEVLPGQGSYYNPDFKTSKGTHRETGYVTEIITEKAKTWLSKQRDKDKPFILMVQHKSPHRNWAPAPKYVSAFDGVRIPEPDTLFDNYEGRGGAARDQDMSIEKTMNMANDLKVDALDHTNRFTLQTLDRMTPKQRMNWMAAYSEKNEVFIQANLKGEELVRWKYQRYLKDYLRCIKSVDDSIGDLRKHLEKLDLGVSTVFIYSSDQGFYLGEHGWFDKRFMYDESYRTPLIASWPGVIKPGSVTSDLVSNLDFAETFLDIAGAKIPKGMQGASLVDIMKGKRPSDWRSTHYYHYYEYPGWHMVQRHEGIYDGRYKLMNFYDLKEWELYDLSTDPKEMKNQYKNPEYAKIVARMHRELETSRDNYDLPKIERQSLENVNMYYHSTEINKRQFQNR
ncbi:MAG: sulfatase [Opitutales bacterium]|nr:sulfatase [Opitutales bacterium]